MSSMAISDAQYDDALFCAFQAGPKARLRVRRLEILSEAAARLLDGQDPDREVLPKLYDALAAELDVDATLGYVIADVQDGLTLSFAKGIDSDLVEQCLNLGLCQEICAKVEATGCALQATNIQKSTDPRTQLVRDLGIDAYVCEPLIVDSQLIGLLSFASRSRSRFDTEDLQFFQAIARHVALARDRARQRAAADENNRALRHRVRGMMSNVQAVAGLSARSAQSMESFVRSLSDRIAALTNAQELIGRSGFAAVDLRELVQSQLDVQKHRHSIILEGPETALPASLAVSLGMAVHELAANAERFGGLSNPQGELELRWRIGGHGHAEQLTIDWIERGGPPVADPIHYGFGSLLLDDLLGDRISVERDFEVAGLRARLLVDLGQG